MLPLAVMMLGILLGVALLGLGRLLILQQGLEADWVELVQFGKSLPLDGGESPEALARALAAAPRGMFLPPVALSDAPLPTSTQAIAERMRAYQATLQSEMKWFAHRITNPAGWFMAGLRGLLLVPCGAALPLTAAGRARRRGYENDPDFQRVVTAVLGVVLFLVLASLFLIVSEGLPALDRALRKLS